MSTEREHAHDRKHDDDHRDHDDRAVGRVNRSAMLTAPANPVTSGLIARKAARDDNGVEAGADQAIATAASSSGMSLPSPIMRKFEASLGADLSGVRVHTGAESQTAASAVGAKAYTMGQDIHFGAGHYDPSSGAGEHLLAHEVAHTVQQGSGTPTRQNKLEVSTPFDPAEHEADTAADAMVAGQRFHVGSGAGLQRKEAGDAGSESEQEAGREGGGGLGVASHFEIPLPAVKLPVDLAKLELAGSISGEIGASDEEAEEDGPVEVGPTVGEHGVGPSAEWTITKERLTKVGGWSIKSKPAAVIGKLDKEGAEIKLAGTLEVSNAAAPWLAIEGEVALEVGGKWKEIKEKGREGLEGAALGIEVAFKGSHSFEDGTKVTIGSSGSGKLTPEWGAIAKQLLGKAAEEGVSTAGETAAAESAAAGSTTETTTVATEATADGAGGTSASDVAAVVLSAEVLIPAALITGGLLTIGAALWQIAQSDQFTELTEPEVRKCRAYCMAYAQAMRCQPMDGGAGAAEGYAAGEARRKELESTVGAASVAQSASGLDLYADAWNKAWPPVRAKMEDAYWQEHYIEKAVYGPEGAGGGFHVLKMLLDGWDRP